MKIQNTMFAVAMMIGSFSAIGCARPEKSASVEETPAAAAAEPQAAAEAPVTTPAAPVTIPAKTTAPAPVAQLPAPIAQLPAPVQYAPYAPPAPRFENPGRAPRADFGFIPGMWRWSGREYTWVPGHWEARRSGYDYQPARWEKVNGRWTQRDGFWKASVRVENDRREPPRRAAVDCDPPRPKQVMPRPAKTSVKASVSVTVKRS